MLNFCLRKDKKAQVTLFVIIAIVIVVLVVLFFSLNKKFNFIGRELSVKDSLENCINNRVGMVDSLLLRQGGISNPQHYLTYNGIKVAYLCYTEEYAKPCVNQQPLLKENIERELTDFSFANISSCVSQEKKRLESKGYSVTVSDLTKGDVSITLLPGRILVNLNLALTAVKADKSEKIDGFKTYINSPAYEYAFLANKIINSEIENADFNQVLYMMLHRGIVVDKIRSNEYVLYKLQNRNSDKVFIFLIRNYPIPPGL